MSNEKKIPYAYVTGHHRIVTAGDFGSVEAFLAAGADGEWMPLYREAPVGDAKDAARYRWLRAKLVAANFHPECPNGLDLGEGVALIFMLPLGAHVNPDLDWTIDQARGKENSNG